MNLALLQILFCPDCHGDLVVRNEKRRNRIVENGKLLCRACDMIFDIQEGIPILLTREQQELQEAERVARKAVVAKYCNHDPADIVLELSRHHYLPSMTRAAALFASRFNETQWILDIGAGWGWHWARITTPNVIALDCSFEQLLVAKKLLLQNIDANVHLVCASAAYLPVKALSVDGIWSVQTLQHLPPALLERCLTQCTMVLRRKGVIEVYWVNWMRPGRIIRQLLGRKVRKEVHNPYYFRQVSGYELKVLLRQYFTGKTKVGYNEIIFHPDLCLTHQLPLASMDGCLGKLPVVNRWLARQIMVRISSAD